MNRNRRHVANDDLVTYRGRPYRALYIGQTKFGPRAHLEFLDGSKDFWVDADLVTDPRDENEDTDHGAAGRAAASEDADADDYPDPEPPFIVTPRTVHANGATGRQTWNAAAKRWETATGPAPTAAEPRDPGEDDADRFNEGAYDPYGYGQ